MLVEKPEGIRRRQVEYARHSSELYKDNHLKSSKTISLSNEGQIQADLQQVQPGLEGTANRSLQVLAFLVVGSIGIRLYYAVTVFSVLHADEFYQVMSTCLPSADVATHRLSSSHTFSHTSMACWQSSFDLAWLCVLH